MNLQSAVLQHISFLETEIKRLETSFKRGNLTLLFCYKNGKQYRYYSRIAKGSKKKNPRTFISCKNPSVLIPIAKATANYYLLQDYKKELVALQAYLKRFPEKNQKAPKFLQNPGIRVLLDKAYSPDSINDWQKEDYPINPYMPEKRINHITETLSVRSKSEGYIASALLQKGIPFRYECEAIIQGTTLYPDFTILHPETGKIIYWEHFGMMDDEEYRQKTAEKIYKYISSGLVPDIDFIATYETNEHPLDLVMVQKKISILLDKKTEH